MGGPLKALERFLKTAAGWLLALAWLRPWRDGRAQRLLTTAKDVFVVRIDNRVGEALLTTPLVAALAPRFRVHLVVHERCARVLEGLPGLHALHTVSTREARWGLLSAKTRALRALARDAVVVSAATTSEYSGTQALFARALAGRGALIGPAQGPAAALADLAVPEDPRRPSEVARRLHLLTPLGLGGEPAALRGAGPGAAEPGGAVGLGGEPRLAFREPRPGPEVTAFAAGLGRPFALVNAGGRLGERRVPPAVFAEAARWLEARGLAVVATWGPGEEPLARQLGGTLAPATGLDDLAFLMRQARLVVCNNTGPMHLAVAVGAPTVALFLRMPPARWGHHHAPHRMVDLTPAAPDAAAMSRLAVAALEDFFRDRDPLSSGRSPPSAGLGPG